MRNIKITVVLTLILIVLFKILLPSPKKNQEEMDQFWYSKTFAKSEYDIVVCGDSRIYRGISIKDLKKPLPNQIEAINLGYSSGGLSSEYLKFAVSKFNKKAKKKILVIGVTPHSLTKEAFKNEALHEKMNIAPAQNFRFRYLSSFLKSFSPYKPIDLISHKKDNYLEEYMPGGWIASSYIIPDSTYAWESYRKTFTEYQVQQKQVNSFLSDLKQYKNQGIKIVAFRPPSTFGMRQLEDSLSKFNENQLKTAIKELGGVWIEYRDGDFSSYDGSHLAKKSAKKLSRFIGLKINKLI